MLTRFNFFIRPFAFAAALLLSAAAFAQSERPKGPLTDEGEIAGAPFRIDIPENWNGGLVMYAHGYAVSGSTPGYNLMMVDVAKRLGYAVAQSRYSKQGWAAREGILDTEALRRHFTDKFGKTYPTIIAGHSQGGMISYRTIEMYPEVYDGALPMCTTPQPALMFFKERVFDMRVLFDYYFPGLPGSAVEFPAGKDTMKVVGQKAAELVKANPEKAEMYIRMVNLPSTEAIPGVLAFWSEILRELQERTGGNAFDNTDTIYEGSPDDAKLNREVARFKADPKSMEYLRQWSTTVGEISDPVIHLHTIVDELIPAEDANYYETLVDVAGTAHLFVQLWVDRVGHCAFNADETHEALARLDTWIREGKRPQAGEITRQQSKE